MKNLTIILAHLLAGEGEAKEIWFAREQALLEGLDSADRFFKQGSCALWWERYERGRTSMHGTRSAQVAQVATACILSAALSSTSLRSFSRINGC